MKLRHWLPLATITLIALLVVNPATRAEDWPKFLGPRGDNTSTETGLLEKWGGNGPPVVWSKTIGTGYGAPSVRGGKLVFHHRLGNEEIIECLEAGTGKPVWRHSYASQYQDPYGYNNGPRCTPLLTTDRCYAFGAEGRLVCLNLADGKLVWERDTAKDWEVPQAFFGVGSTPILEGDLLITMIGGQPNSGVVALDAKTGKTVWESVGEKNWTGQPMLGWPGDRLVEWKRWEKQASYSSPVAATVNGQRLVFCLMRQGLVALDPKTGKVNFSRWFRARMDESVNAMNPVVIDDMVLFCAAYYQVGAVMLKIKPDNKGFDEVWKSTALETHWMTPVYHEGNLYAFSGRNEPDAHFRCVEFKTGKVLWDRDETWPPHSTLTPPVYGRGSLLKADGRLIALGEGGKLGMFKLNPQAAEEICTSQIANLHYPCWAAPILSEKKLYIRSEDHLVCLNLAKP